MSRRKETIIDSSTCHSSQRYSTVCPKSGNRWRPCYSRRCICLDCRNKATWKEYTILVRSLQRRPATHFITLVFQPWYHGHDITARLNKFFRILSKRVGVREMLYQWRYDGNVPGHWPHVHVLVQCPKEIGQADTFAAWCETWADEDEVIEANAVHVRTADDDYITQAVYLTKHNEDTHLVRKSLWSGLLTGGSKRFFAAKRKVLFKDEHYREQRDTVEYAELLRRYEVMFCTTADTSNDTEVEQDGSSLCIVLSQPTRTKTEHTSTKLIVKDEPARERKLPCVLYPIPPPRPPSKRADLPEMYVVRCTSP